MNRLIIITTILFVINGKKKIRDYQHFLFSRKLFDFLQKISSASKIVFAFIALHRIQFFV